MEAVTFKKLVKGHAYSVTGAKQVRAAALFGAKSPIFGSRPSWVPFADQLPRAVAGSDPHAQPMGRGGVDRSLER